MTDIRLPNGALLTDTMIAPCGCVFGVVDPAAVGVEGAPDETGFVCIPCSLLCPIYTYFQMEAARQNKESHIRRMEDL